MSYSISIPRYLPKCIVRVFVGAVVLLSTLNSSFAQTDTEFWFVVPEITISHNNPGGRPAYFRFSTGEFEATITISMPANEYHALLNPTGFVPITFNMPANSMYTEDVSDLIAQQIAGTWTDMDLMENKPLTADGINKFGLKIVSNNPVTCYFESGNTNNKDLYSLKGKNALGTEFFTPFQTWSYNSSRTQPAYSAIDVVATEDGTSITFELQPGIAASYGGPGGAMTNIAPGGTHTIILNQGETFSLFPIGKSRNPADRLVGTRVTSTKPIAVTIKDDSVYHNTTSTGTGPNDQYGDQLVPTSIIGLEYAIINTGLTNPRDDVYVLATQDGTTVNIDGTDYSLDAGEQEFVRFSAAYGTKPFIRVISDKPVYVLHIGGAAGQEIGGAILPPIDQCTGNTEVFFNRSFDQPFYIILMVRKDAKNNFKRFVNGTEQAMPAITWHDLPNPSEWSVTKIDATSETDYPVDASLKFTNSENIFHLGIVNGNSSGGGCFYGYFSDFNVLEANGVVAGTGSQFIRSCYGTEVQLYATGGLEYKWYEGTGFDPAVTLNNDTIYNPFANPESNTVYNVVVSGLCNMKDTAQINVQVSEKIVANFTTDIVAGCAPLEVTFTDNSIGVYSWQYDMGDGTPYYTWDKSGTNPPPSPFNFTHTFDNTTDQPVEYTITLLAKRLDGCNDIYTKRIVVYPRIEADYGQTIVGANCDNPREVQFTNNSSTYTNDDYYWDFGDGFNRVSDVHNEVFTHNFTNTLSSSQTFDIQMVAVSPFACRDTVTSQVTVTSAFEPSFAVDITSGCSPLDVQVNNTSTGDLQTYSWTLSPNPDALVLPSDGSNFPLQLTNTTNAPVDYELSLTVTNTDGCSKTTPVQTITVNPEVNPGFTMPAEVCNATSVSFTNTTTPSTTPMSTFSWDFGDGAGSSLANPNHTYNNISANATGYIPNTYTVELTVTNPWGCSSSVSQNITVGSLVQADFTLLPGEGCSPLEVVFDNNSLGNISSDDHLWVFGDGSLNSNVVNPGNKIYTNDTDAPIKRTVTYTRTNSQGCASSLSKDIKIFPKVNVDFTPTNITICDSVQVDFAATVTPALPNMIHSWSFGDGSSGLGTTPSHIYRNLNDTEEDYTVTLVSTSEYACNDIETTTIKVSPYIKALFSVDKDEICSGESITFTYNRMPSILNYTFEFDGYTDNAWPGDGAANGSFTKTFTNNSGTPMPITVRLTVSNGNGGCDKVYEIPIVVNPAITPGFTWSDNGNALGCEPLNVSFTNTTVYNGGGAFNGTYSWNFGDGTSSAEASPSHTFSNNNPLATATYTVTLTVTSEHGCVATAPTQDIIVQPRLTAGFTFDQSSNCTPFDVTFNPGSSVGATQYHWSYDGAISNETLSTNAPFTRTFTSTDPNSSEWYDITLTVENDAGCTDALTRTIEVFPEVIADFTNIAATPIDGCADHTVTFSNQSTGGSLTFVWDFGDGLTYTNTNIAEEVTHTFTNNGTTDIPYTVRLTAINPNGCSTYRELPVTVHPKVEANFSIASIASCVSATNPFELDVSAPAIANISYSWDFNGETRTGTNPVFSQITQNRTGTDDYYNIVLTATGLGGCSDTKTETVTIYPEVQAQWDLTAPTDYCAPVSAATFDNTSDLYAGGSVTNIQWQVFDGPTLVTSSSAQSFTPTLPNTSHTTQKTYDVHLTATSVDGCVGQDNGTITVNPNPLAKFEVDITDNCTPTVINVTNNSVTTGPDPYNWNWDTNGVATDENDSPIVVTYSNNTEFVEGKWIELEVTNEHGCKDFYDYTFEVYPELSSQLTLLSSNLTANCDNDEYVFSNLATKGESISEYRWVVENTSTGTTNSYPYGNDSDFSETFRNFGTTPVDYTITLTAENHLGCTEDDSYSFTVYPRVIAAQSFIITDECNGTTIDLTNASSNKSIANSTFVWEFTTTDDGANRTVTSPSDNLSGINLINNHAVNTALYNLEFTTSTVWNQGTANARTCLQTISGQDVTVYPILNPIYDIPPAVCSGLNGADLEFVKNASSSGGDVNDVSLQWDFSDGNTRTTTFDPLVTKLFTNLSDEDFITSTKIFATQIATGCTVQREVDVRVHPKVESIFTFEIGDVCEYPLPVTFANSSKYSKAQTGVPTEFIWDYGYQLNGNPEGETLTPSEVSHSYHFYNDEPNQIQEYDVSLTVTQYHEVSDSTCANTFTRKIQVYPEMLPSFNLPTTEGCNPLTVSFNNTSTGVNLVKADGTTAWNGQFVWDLGNGSTSSSITPATREYGHADKTQSHIYDVSLTATNPLGCVKTATTSTPQVTVYPWVESSFAVDRIEGCTPLDVVLSNTSKSSEYSYQWTFNGDGAAVSPSSSSTDAEPGTVTFTNPLGANAELLVQSPEIALTTSLKTAVYTVGGGCAKTSTPIQVSVFPHVYPSFDATLEGCHPLDIDFQNTSNVFGQTDNGNYTWDLGIGIQTNNQDPSQKYQNPLLVEDKAYKGTLTAVSEHGCTDFIDFEVTVWPKPQARIELDEYMECSPFNLEIINQSIGKGKGSTLEFTYDFGDESDDVVTTDEGSVTHSYRNFSDEIEPFTMSLYVETEDGCNDIAYQTVHAYPEVTAIFDTDDGVYEQCNPFEVEFVNSSLNAWSYIWDFDNGITSSTSEPVYRFDNNSTQDRTYNVTLTAMSEYDCEHTSDLEITVFAAPIADFAISPPHQVYPQDDSGSSFEFINQSRPQGMPATWTHSWTFGDGHTSSSMDKTVPHTYDHWGFREDDFRYEVTLSIDNGKCSDFISNKLTLLPPEPISMYRADNYRSCSPLVIKFFNDSHFFLSENNSTAFEWRLNNAEEPFSTEFEPTLTLTEPGYYNIGLRVYGDGGEKNYYRTFRVFENPVANFEAMPERVLLPNAKVHFFNLSENANKYVWDFGDGAPKSSEKDPIHVYDELGEYRVSLMAFAEYEHKDDDGNIVIQECMDYDSRFPAVWVEGEGTIRFPNAFMPSKLGPNGGYYDDVDYKNEVFHPVADGVIEYRLMIFNRWGEQIFESNDIKIGWDGYYQGKMASQDVYVWRAVGKFSNGELFDLRGNVTLLR